MAKKNQKSAVPTFFVNSNRGTNGSRIGGGWESCGKAQRPVKKAKSWAAILCAAIQRNESPSR